MLKEKEVIIVADQHNSIGRPKAITEEKLYKLREAFMKGFTDVEACLYVGIAPATLYNYCSDNPDFLEEKEYLKEQPKIKAKMNLEEAINNGDKDISKWYLERKSRNEFSLKQELDLGNKDGKPLAIDLTSLTIEQIKDILDGKDK